MTKKNSAAQPSMVDSQPNPRILFKAPRQMLEQSFDRKNPLIAVHMQANAELITSDFGPLRNPINSETRIIIIREIKNEYNTYL